MKVEARIRTDEGARSAIVEGPDYDAAKVAAEAQVVEGEQLLFLRRLED